MAINYYVGSDGFTVFLENETDIAEAIDLLHTQVMDNIGQDKEEHKKILRILEDTLTRLEVECGIELEY
jgi:hypothetical protein